MRVEIISILTTLLINNISNINNQNEIFCSFSNSKKILFTKKIKDFNNNEFKLYELEDGYAIYDNKGEIIEGSYSTNSLYFNVDEYNELYYIGPGNYYYLYKEKLYNLKNKKEVDYNLLKDKSLKKNDREELENVNELTEESPRNSVGPSNNSNNTFIDDNGFMKIKNAYYFENLSYFPNNNNDCCGIVASSILLGYLDTFFNDDFIINDYYYSDDGTLDKYLYSGTVVYGSDNYLCDKWDIMPGTGDAFKNYLMDNYMELAINNDWVGGYPMDGYSIYKTIRNYLNDNSPYLLNNITASYSSVALAKNNIKNTINEGRPALAVLLSYETDNGYNLDLTDFSGHVVVAYGYKEINNNICFLTHFGWEPNELIDTEIIINSGYFYGSYNIKYNGEHVHSTNVKMNYDGSTAFVCGCGHVFWPVC